MPPRANRFIEPDFSDLCLGPRVPLQTEASNLDLILILTKPSLTHSLIQDCYTAWHYIITDHQKRLMGKKRNKVHFKRFNKLSGKFDDILLTLSHTPRLEGCVWCSLSQFVWLWAEVWQCQRFSLKELIMPGLNFQCVCDSLQPSSRSPNGGNTCSVF